MTAKQNLFVVVREDRHLDPEITVHSTRALADAACEEFIARYDYDDEWQTEEIDGWLRYVTHDEDDGPSVRIEAATLDPDIGLHQSGDELRAALDKLAR